MDYGDRRHALRTFRHVLRTFRVGLRVFRIDINDFRIDYVVDRIDLNYFRVNYVVDRVVREISGSIVETSDTFEEPSEWVEEISGSIPFVIYLNL